jgi:Cu/Ag efflux protein CusF
MKTILSFAAAVVLVTGLAILAHGEDKAGDKPGAAMVNVQSITATVEAIDYKARTVTLKGAGGNLVVLKVGEEARNFNQVKKGDRVTFDYYEAIAVDVQKSTGEPRATETQSITRAKPGERPGGTIETTSILTAKVEKIDYQTRMVALKLPEGNTMTIRAGDQVKRLNEVKAGDEVMVTYTEAVAISVQKP